jgi:hypothetical protein
MRVIVIWVSPAAIVCRRLTAQSRRHGRPASVTGFGEEPRLEVRLAWLDGTNMRNEQPSSSACNCSARRHRATGGLPGRRWCGAGAIVAGSAAPTLDPGVYSEDPVHTRNTEMSLKGEAGNSFGDQAVHPACRDCHIASHVCGSGPLPRKRRCGVSVVFAARFACPVHPFGTMPGPRPVRAGSAWFTSARPPGRLSLDIEARHAR